MRYPDELGTDQRCAPGAYSVTMDKKKAGTILTGRDVKCLIRDAIFEVPVSDN